MSFINALSAVIKILKGFSQPPLPVYGAPNGDLKTNCQMWTLQREKEVNGCVFGEFSNNIVDKNIRLVSLENPTAIIPAGRYSLSLYNSPHAGHLVPLLTDVPGRTEIEIHCGNVPTDSKGCILVGLTHSPTELLESHAGFSSLMSCLKLPASLTVLDA